MPEFLSLACFAIMHYQFEVIHPFVAKRIIGLLS